MNAELKIVNENDPLPEGYLFMGYLISENKIVCIRKDLEFTPIWTDHKPLQPEGEEKYYYKIKSVG